MAVMTGGTSYWPYPYCCGVLLIALLLLLPETQAGRCLQYSWLGTEFTEILKDTEQLNKGSESFRMSNLSCKEFPQPKPIPCVTPFLITKDAITPQPEKVYNSFNSSDILCDPGDGNVCALVTFQFGNEVVNQTAYCTRVTDDGTYMKNGCATARKGAYTNTVCVCNPSLSHAQFCIPSGALCVAADKLQIIVVCITVILLSMQENVQVGK